MWPWFNGKSPGKRTCRPRFFRPVTEALEERSLLAISVQASLPWSLQEGRTLSGFIGEFCNSNTTTEPDGYGPLANRERERLREQTGQDDGSASPSRKREGQKLRMPSHTGGQRILRATRPFSARNWLHFGRCPTGIRRLSQGCKRLPCH